jgi:hypothetical protein
LNQLTNDQKKELRRREYLTYTRRNKASAPPSQPDTPLPSTEKVAPPPPPPVREFLPKPTPADDIQLNVDVASMFGKLNMTVPVTEMCEDPPIILNTMYLDRPRDMNPPFYLSLDMNGLHLNNCILDYACHSEGDGTT